MGYEDNSTFKAGVTFKARGKYFYLGDRIVLERTYENRKAESRGVDLPPWM